MKCMVKVTMWIENNEVDEYNTWMADFSKEVNFWANFCYGIFQNNRTKKTKIRDYVIYGWALTPYTNYIGKSENSCSEQFHNLIIPNSTDNFNIFL